MRQKAGELPAEMRVDQKEYGKPNHRPSDGPSGGIKKQYDGQDGDRHFIAGDGPVSRGDVIIEKELIAGNADTNRAKDKKFGVTPANSQRPRSGCREAKEANIDKRDHSREMRATLDHVRKHTEHGRVQGK